MSNLSPVSKLEVQYDRQLVMDLSKVQSKVSGRGRQLGIAIAALFSLLIALGLIGSVQAPFNYLFAAYGCFSIVFMNVPAKWRAEKLIAAIEKSGRGYPCSVFEFGSSMLRVNTRGNTGKPVELPYKSCHRLIETENSFYYFASPQAAYPIPFSSIPAERKDGLRQFLEKATGLHFAPVRPLWSLNLKEFLSERKNIRTKK